ncbi:uncharacterized protein EI97DRAFT_434991 [Westerdykella ornata]|uniref:U3 small nucleolar RNA-associated protein 10 n=1 Tax=Westerdykella ornata TaxID=318751 RepID=A0A6A6JEV0_WESOR|nr:uncharacterized protein EI97DRAFT_434991 [Westerdykella ornata]KAF2274764.1 hypothetical protein EI97DRAFT_434991 [Westerdykella ornata]
MTSLQKQLAAIAASSTHQLDLKAQKAAHGKSLLYEPRVAASQSFESIYVLCCEGYRDLCALDQRFVPFARNLFSEQSKDEDRAQMTKKENEELDSVLEAFMTLVGPRILLKPAEKALEWLVRRFRIHEYNTEFLVLTYLPYHATPQFLALLSILPSNLSPALRFLLPYLTPPSNPPRQAIVYAAANTPPFFTALQGYVVRVLQAGHEGHSLLTLWSGVTAQAVDAIFEQTRSGRQEIQAQRTEEALLRTLPVLNQSLRMRDIPEALLGSYAIIIIMVTKAVLPDKVLDSLMEAVVRSYEPETAERCLMCLAVIAEERSQPRLPAAVVKGISKIQGLVSLLRALASTCTVARLALGCALGDLDRNGNTLSSGDGQTLFLDIVESGLLNGSYLSTCLNTVLEKIRNSPPGSTQHSVSIDIATRLSESPQTFPTLRKLLEKNSTEFESMGLSFQDSLIAEEVQSEREEDDEMLDLDQVAESGHDSTSIIIPTITATSLLDPTSRDSFLETLAAFEQAMSLNRRAAGFLNSEGLGRQDAFERPLFFSFLARTWCAPVLPSLKVLALRSAIASIKELDSGTDLQHLTPYLLCGLADSAPPVRRASATCISLLAQKSEPAGASATHTVWGASTLYGKESAKLCALPKGHLSAFLSSELVHILEACVLDPNYIITSMRNLFESGQSSKTHQGSMKSSAKAALASFMASHVALTPSLRVRLCLLPLFGSSGKSTGSARLSTILPVVRSWCQLSAGEVSETCRVENIEAGAADREHVATLLPREQESLEILREVLSGRVSEGRLALVDAAFERLTVIWLSMKSETRLSLAQTLLDLSLKDDCKTAVQEHCKSRSLETLRNLKLDTAILLEFIENAPATLQMPEGPPAKKRRRTSRNEMARLDMQSADDVTRIVRKLTLILELIEGSNAAEHTLLFKKIFALFGDMQHLKQQSDSELVYLQSLILGSLTPMVNQLKNEPDTSDLQGSVRVDLLIECIRHSSSPQVQNAALLLIASLASWVPELVLHNLMPVFTFIGATLLHKNDEYSAHVLDQTISRVVPQLASSLKVKHQNFLTGVADLLLSFTAAFEHIPPHRRLKLFTELARTLGPEDSLSAIVALLLNKPVTSAPRKFVPELLLQFEPTLTLETIRGYLHLMADAAGHKRTVSDTLFGLSNMEPSQVESMVSSLLSTLADLATSKSLRGHIAKAFRKSRNPAKPRAIFADIVEATIRLSKSVAENARIQHTCSRILANCLDLLPTSDLIRTAELLLVSPDCQIALAVVKAVEIRAGHVIQNDAQSVQSLLSFLRRLDELLQQHNEGDVKSIAISCIERIVERFGKKDVAAVGKVARTISGSQSLMSTEDRVRILSLICLTSIVDVLSEEAISLLPTVLPQAFIYLQESIDKDNIGLHNAVFSLLSKVIERLAFVFTSEYLVPALELAHHSAAGGMDDACDEQRTLFYRVVATGIGAQEAFTAIKTTWPSALSQGYQAAREHLDLLAQAIDHQTKKKLIATSAALFTLLSEMFDLRKAIRDAEAEESIDEDEIEALETSLVNSVIAMTLKLNDTTFRPFFVQLVDSASSSSDEAADLERSVTLCKFLAVFFDKLKSIVTSYSSYIIEHLSHLLTYLATHPADSPTLAKAVLDTLHNSFKHDQDSFWQAPSHYGAILEPLLKQLTVDSPLLLAEHVIPTITELAVASSSSTDNHRQMNSILLKYMRAEEAHTRLATVKCEQGLTKRLGEEWLSLLPEMLPFISELREDDDEMVERETQRWITMVEEILGEDLEGMLQ